MEWMVEGVGIMANWTKPEGRKLKWQVKERRKKLENEHGKFKKEAKKEREEELEEEEEE